MPSVIEDELVKATNFIPAKKYRLRQDYLTALLMATVDLTPDEFDALSDAAAIWTNAAAKARKTKNDLPEFKDYVESEGKAGGPHVLTIEDRIKGGEAGSEGKGRKAFVATKGTPMSARTGEFDKFGLAIGTKLSEAAGELEKGITMRHLRDKFHGVAFYNLLKRLREEGHKITNENAFWTLTHKDEVK